jgi:hypothetical protein
MWLEIKNICGQHGYRLTVYMDDMGISAAHISEKVIWRIKQEVHTRLILGAYRHGR